MIPARRLITAKHAQDVTFASQPEGGYGHLQVLDNLQMLFCTDSRLLYKLKLSRNPSQAMSTVAAVIPVQDAT